MMRTVRRGRGGGRLDLKGDGHLVVEIAVGRERREGDRGERRRDLRGRPWVGM